MPLQQRAGGGHRRGIDIIDEHDRVRVAHRKAGGLEDLAARLQRLLERLAVAGHGQVGAIEAGPAHIDRHLADLAIAVDGQLEVLDPGARLEVEGAPHVITVGEVLADHADTVSTHLGDRSVGIAVVHEERGRRAWGDADHPVRADAEMPVADLAHELGTDLVTVLETLDDHEVVAGPMCLDELHGYPSCPARSVNARIAHAARSGPGGRVPHRTRGSLRNQASWRSEERSTRLNSSHVRISYAVFC